MSFVRIFLGGAFAAQAVRMAIMTARHLRTADDTALALLAMFTGGCAALLLYPRGDNKKEKTDGQ